MILYFKAVLQNFTAGPQKEPSVGISDLWVDIRNWDLHIRSTTANRCNEMPDFSELLLSHSKYGTDFILE
jgi:hypothetical protein